MLGLVPEKRKAQERPRNGCVLPQIGYPAIHSLLSDRECGKASLVPFSKRFRKPNLILYNFLNFVFSLDRWSEQNCSMTVRLVCLEE